MKNNYTISEKIYPESFIQDSIVIFKDFADIEYVNWVLSLPWDNDTEINELFNEFMNYVIYLINE